MERSKRRRKKSKRPFLTIIMLLFIILSATFLVKGRLPFFFDKVVAGGIAEEDNGVINDNIPDDKDNEISDIDNNEEKGSTENPKNENINKNPQGGKDGGDVIKSNEKQLIENVDDILIVINKKRYLDSDYKPNDLVVPNVKFSFDGEHEKKYMRQEAASALEELFNQAKEEGIYLYAVSGYRSYSTQERLFKNRANRVGEEEANKLSARPGESEHQTGLAMDITSQSAKFDLIEEFGDTEEGKWLKDNAHKFGFIIRYLKEKTDITGYSYEPWHIRYVGKDVAKKIYNEGITLEEYFGFE
ncbi:M15 family metallopeptidase [Alkaliphilus sp. MSJ-5]|uniref:M15 family metallopeptidase n=1 Tax=Alkaliphilus flagellatus TaxID=2841507 RepID=A0ABS6FY88_9FIRM|nr:M15 family metallopeptidase [Alkaliphilus flagellatus]MBU5675201.1 M15 family metallopeptidase [Alkaliphilus flagellatus]